MKFFKLLLWMVLLNTLGYSQQKPYYTQYILNNYILNPALSGIENYTDVKLSYRDQWVGLQNAPVTSYFTIQGSIGKQDYRTNATSLFQIPGENPRGNDYWRDYQPSAPHHGIGLQIINDATGPFNNFSIMGTYAYHIGLSRRTNLSAGVGFGASKLTLNSSQLFFGNAQPVDPAVWSSDAIGQFRPDMNAGLWLYSATYFVGLAVDQLLPNKLDFSDNHEISVSKGKMEPHFFGTAGIRTMLSDDVNMIPSIMIKSITNLPIQVDINTKIQYQDFLWLGASYRLKDGFAAMAGCNMLKGVTISYSYDYSTTLLNTVSNGTHEIIIGFIIGNKYNSDTCPRNMW